MAKKRPPRDDDSSEDPGRRPDRDPVKFPFGESLDDSMADGPDPVKFPFGETGERPGARPFGESLSEIGRLDDSDIGAYEDFEGSDPFSSSQSGERLPGVPPGSHPQDDASLDGLEDALIHASASGDPSDDSGDFPGPGLTPSELGELIPTSDMGHIGPSGPLVIVEEGDDVSTRYQASVVDDSIRVAGRKSVRRPKRRPKPPKKVPPPQDLEQSSEWSEEPLSDDVSVPTPSERRSRRGSRRSSSRPPPAPSSRKAPLLIGVIGILAAAGVGIFQEQRRLADLKALEEKSGVQLEAAHTERREAVEQLEQTHSQALDAQREQLAEATARHATETARLQKDLAAAEGREATAEGALEDETRRAAEALEVELARARAEISREVDADVRAELQAEHERALEAERARAAEEKARLEEDLRLARDEVEALKAELEEARLNAPTSEVDEWGDPGWDDEGSDGGGDDGGGGDDWDDFFGDDENAGDDGGEDEFADDGENPLAEFWTWTLENTPLHGSLAYKNFTHFSTGPPGNDLQKVRNEARVLIGYKGWLYQTEDQNAGIRLVAGLDIKYDDDEYTEGAIPRGVDDDEDKRPVIVPDEIYLALTYDFLTFRGGYQKYAWGTGDLYNPTDRLNPIDYSDLFDPREIPILAYTLALDFEAVSFEAAFVPTFTRSRLPLQGERFDILATAGVPVIAPDDPETSIDNSQIGGRVTVRQFGWDVTFSGYTGFDPVPAGQVAIQSVFPIVGQVVTEFNKIHVAGLDFATTLGFLGLDGPVGDLLSGIQLHGEAAHVWYEGESNDDLVQYVFGFNYQFIDIIAESDLTLIVEYAGELETHTAEQPLPGTTLSRVFQSAWLARIAYDPIEDLSIAVNVAYLVHGPDSIFIHPEATWDITDYLELVVGMDIFAGQKDTFFGQFGRDDRFVGQVRVLF